MKYKIQFPLLFILLVFHWVAFAGISFPDIQGWKLQEEQRVYNSGDLWELIDGAADIFLSYDFEDLHIAEYLKNDQIIRVELYRHAGTENAYGIYTSERMPDYTQVAIGTQGYRSQGILNFLAGIYYVKIMSAGQEEAEESAISQVARAVNDRLEQSVGLPEVLKMFPTEGLEFLSDTYIARNFLGYGFLHSAYTCRYQVGTGFQLFIIRADPGEVQHMLSEYLKQVKEVPVRKEDLYVINDPYNGTVFLREKGNYLVGIINTTDEARATAYIDQVIDQIPK